ncbi:MAG: hypothetical protein ACEQSX_04050 [Baekduiaceae bacterium]
MRSPVLLAVCAFALALPSVAAAEPSCTVTGTADADVLVGTPGPDVICGLEGNDVLRGRGGDDILRGGLGNDTLHGEQGRDTLDGGESDDLLIEGTGVGDEFIGGPGNDTASYANWIPEGSRGVFYTRFSANLNGLADDGGYHPGLRDPAEELDRIDASVENIAAYDDVAGDDRPNVLTGGQVNGRGGKDQVNGRASDDTLNGGDGRDRVSGGPGDDVLDGGSDDPDVLTCGAGFDEYVDDARDTLAGCEARKLDSSQARAGGAHSCELEAGFPEDREIRCWGANDRGQLGDGTTTSRTTSAVVAGLTRVSELDLGGEHTCAAVGGERLWCWGANDRGQLGDGTTTDRHTPTQLPTANVRGLAAGGRHTCIVDDARRVVCWGANDRGQLGDDTTADRTAPSSPVGGLILIRSVAAGQAHTCAITVERTVICWGANDHGQLGDGTTTDRHTPTPIPGLSDVASLSAGRAHTCAVRRDGTLRCWGANGEGQLGDGTTTDRHTPTPVSFPTENGIPSDTVREVTAGGRHTCALAAASEWWDSSSGVWCWGASDAGQFSDEYGREPNTPAEQLSDLWDPSSIAAGDDHTCVEGRSCWGDASRSQLPGRSLRWVNRPPHDIPGLTATRLDGANGSVCAVRGDTSLWCWGDNRQGQLGDGSLASRATPAPVPGLVGVNDVSGGGTSFCALASTGRVSCWGDLTGTETPVPVTGMGSAIAVSVGAGSACAVKSDGRVWCWTKSAPVPVRVGGVTDATAVASSCALKSDGTVWCWRSSVSPGSASQLAGLSGVVAVSGGEASCARKSDGSVWCWGQGSGGQLGDGTRVTRAAPGPVLGVSAAIDLDVEGGLGCAADSAQRLSCWGAVPLFAFGAFPGVVPGLDAMEIAGAGSRGACARREDGTVACWGSGPVNDSPDLPYSRGAVKVP